MRKHLYRGDPLAEPPPAALAEIIARYVGKRDGLISVFQEIQGKYGYLPELHLKHVSRGLGIPFSRIYGVATFYNQFRFSAPGRHIVRVCRGTACHVGNSDGLLATIKSHLLIDEDQTTPDGEFTLQTVACMGCCSLAPVMTVNDATFGKITPEKAVETLERVRAGQLELKG